MGDWVATRQSVLVAVFLAYFVLSIIIRLISVVNGLPENQMINK